MTTCNPSTSLLDDIEERQRRQAKRVSLIRAALAQSPALIFTEGDHIELVIVSGETHPGQAPLRATTFLVDGPWGHENYRTKDEIAKALASRTWTRVHPADDDEVMEWTSTPEFVEGAKRVAYVQAANALRYWAGQHGYQSEAWKRTEQLLRETDRMDPSQIDEATARVEKQLRAVAPAEKNPTWVSNPAWVTTIMTQAYETVAGQVPPAWLPKLSRVRSSRGQIIAHMREYGCGVYGCVFPTLDDNVVLKVTSDESEADFATDLSDGIAAPIVVAYYTVLKTSSKYHGRWVYLLWRESAEAVGELEAELGGKAVELVNIQHAAAADVIGTVMGRESPKRIEAALAVWLDTCDQMAEQEDVPELAPLGRGMARVFREQHVFFGDVHTGNLGRVTRDGIRSWVITDPGNVLVFGKE